MSKENAQNNRCMILFRRHHNQTNDLDGHIYCSRCGRYKYILASGSPLWAFPDDVELLSDQQDTATPEGVATLQERAEAIADSHPLDTII